MFLEYIMADLYEMFLGPLPESYCLYFQVITVFSLLMIAMVVVGIVSTLLTNGKQSVPVLLGGLVGYIMVYLQNRILHTMCAKTL